MEDDSFEGKASPDLFFSKEVDLFKVDKDLTKKHLLAPLSAIFGEDIFAKVYMGWNSNGLLFRIEVQKEPPFTVLYPDFSRGDSIELFIDTRQIAQSKSTHRFYHHFYFMPESFEGHMKGECSRFRTEDSHPLCSEDLLECKIEQRINGYIATVEIPKEALVGYDPATVPSLGFTYRINRADGPSQHFAMTQQLSRIDSMPSLWAVLCLVGDK